MALGKTIVTAFASAATVAAAICLATPSAASASTAPSSTETGTGTVRLAVGYRASASAKAIAGIERGAGVTHRSDVAALHASVVEVPAGRASSALAALKASKDVAYAEVDHASAAADVAPNDPYYPFLGSTPLGGQWGDLLDKLPAAWALTTGSASVPIAIVDSGVMSTHPDLQPVLVPGWNVLTRTADTNDTGGHGTNVAGAAVAASNNAIGIAGACWTCPLMPVKVTNSGSAYNSDIAAGVTWATDHGAKVINISYAGTAADTTLGNAVAYAIAHNVVVVAAAGNYGTTAQSWPAAFPGVISVAASGQQDSLATYSNYGSWVDVDAPAGQTTTYYDGTYINVGGTSLASPVVAGIAGLMLSAKPTATPAEIQSAMMSTADPVQGTHTIASGRINAYNAITALTGGTASPPPAPAPAPVNTTLPTLSGTAVSGQTITTTNGTWNNSPSSYSYQWQRCDSSGANCAAIAGATSASYVLTSADVTSTVRSSVTATNAGGSATATSAATSVVSSPATGTAPKTTTFTGSLGSGKSGTSKSFSATAGAGAGSGSVSFATSCASLTLTVKTAAGATVASGSGPSVLSVTATLAAGTYTWTVSGSCKVSFTLTVTTAS